MRTDYNLASSTGNQRLDACGTPPPSGAGNSRAAGATPRSRLLRAREMRDFALRDDRLDVRGWQVYSNDAQLVGSVESLFVEIRSKAIRYLGVALRDPRTRMPAGTVLVPVGAASRAGNRTLVVLTGLSATQLASAPRLPRRHLTEADEDATLAVYGMATSRDLRDADFYKRPGFAEQPLFGDGASA